MNRIKPVCTAYDRILAIERLHTLTARTDECFNTYKSREGKNRARGDHSHAPRLDMLISYQLTTDKPDVEVSRTSKNKIKSTHTHKKHTYLQVRAVHTTGAQMRALSEVLSSSTTNSSCQKPLSYMEMKSQSPGEKTPEGQDRHNFLDSVQAEILPCYSHSLMAICYWGNDMNSA